MQVEQGKDKLQQALTEAQSQLAVSEAKVATLQASLQQAESRAATLDLQLKPKSTSDTGDSTFCQNLLISAVSTCHLLRCSLYLCPVFQILTQHLSLLGYIHEW